MRRWDNIRVRNTLHLEKPFSYTSLRGDRVTVPPGKYYVTGYWATAVGISTHKSDARNSRFEYLFPSWMLSKFKGVKK